MMSGGLGVDAVGTGRGGLGLILGFALALVVGSAVGNGSAVGSGSGERKSWSGSFHDSNVWQPLHFVSENET